MTYRPKQYGVIRDETNVAEIAGHRPALATRIHDKPPFDPDAPAEPTLRGQPTEIVEDESYHHGMNVAKFNELLRSGLGTGRGSGSDGE